ncbi:hypothetical protein GOV11_03365 [Candidatus Woesearchaeota archaeon]|nr:hypothetical protein [Candidatus Woesearchaeota archaeon]
MEEMVTIPKKEYDDLKRKAGENNVQDDTLTQAKQSLEDVRAGRVYEVIDDEDLQ